jgi:hypothetical protein
MNPKPAVRVRPIASLTSAMLFLHIALDKDDVAFLAHQEQAAVDNHVSAEYAKSGKWQFEYIQFANGVIGWPLSGRICCSDNPIELVW